MREVLRHGAAEMRRPVEIEFAVTIDAQKRTGIFYLLQIRPMVDVKADVKIDLDSIDEKSVILRSQNVLGHGIMDEMRDIVYVKTQDYNPANNPAIAEEVEKLNDGFLAEGGHYVLVGPGRWGSSDSWLGVPVKWPHISAARVIVEEGLTNYRVDPSQGTHFFQNLTSFGVGYFTINPSIGDGVFDEEYLNSLPAISEGKYTRHVRLPHPMTVMMDGKRKLGVVLKAEA